MPTEPPRADQSVKAVLTPTLSVLPAVVPPTDFAGVCSSSPPRIRERIAFLTGRLRL